MLGRLQELQQLQARVDESDKQTTAHASCCKDLVRDLLRAKKGEQVRIVKESELMDIFFSARQIAKSERRLVL